MSKNPFEGIDLETVLAAVSELRFFGSDGNIYQISRVGIKGNSFSEKTPYYGHWRVIRNPYSGDCEVLLNPAKDKTPLLAGYGHEGSWCHGRLPNLSNIEVNEAIFFDTAVDAYRVLTETVNIEFSTLP